MCLRYVFQSWVGSVMLRMNVIAIRNFKTVGYFPDGNVMEDSVDFARYPVNQTVKHSSTLVDEHAE